MTFAEKIKALRKEKGMTQLKLAQATNISLAVIAGVESGRRNPSKEMARRLSEYFCVPIETFIVEDVDIQKITQKPTMTPTMVTLLEVVDSYAAKHNINVTAAQKATMVNHLMEENEKDPVKAQKDIDGLINFLLKLQQAQAL